MLPIGFSAGTEKRILCTLSRDKHPRFIDPSCLLLYQCWSNGRVIRRVWTYWIQVVGEDIIRPCLCQINQNAVSLHLQGEHPNDKSYYEVMLIVCSSA